MTYAIRPATAADVPAISAIYNHYVELSTCTYQYTPEALADRVHWFENRGPQHPVVVAVGHDSIVPAGRHVENVPHKSAVGHDSIVPAGRHVENVPHEKGEVIGWGALSPWNSRCGYVTTVESSVYIRHDWHRKGLGLAIMNVLVGLAPQLGHHTIIAGVSAEQQASLELHRRLGFVEVSRFREVGKKFGQWLDVIHLQLMLG